MIGTLLVGATSPLFVRTYESLSFDTVRGTWTLRPGTHYRWRSEGYATTMIGPHGMPGRIDLPPDLPPTENPNRIIALWGDSQAEGVGVTDDQKLWAAMQRSIPGTEVLPLARSGEDARVWTSQMRRVEADLGVQEHTLLIAELSDLEALADSNILGNDYTDEALTTSNSNEPNSASPQQAKSKSRNSEHSHRRARSDLVPDFVVHAIVGILGGTHPSQFRSLRFGLGPVSKSNAKTAKTLSQSEIKLSQEKTWNAVLKKLSKASDCPIQIAYAPRLPLVIGDQIKTEDPDDSDFAILQSQLATGQYPNIVLVDCRDSLLRSSEPSRFPHGFHHGIMGSGHLNAHGYAVIADTIAKSNVIVSETQTSETQTSETHTTIPVSGL